MITKHSYSGKTFDGIFESFNPQEKQANTNQEQMIKVASGCVDCPYAGRVGSTACNTCKYASGISYAEGNTYIKCSYVQSNGLKKEASSVQGFHWDSGILPQKEAFEAVQDDIRIKITEELKFAARNIGVQLAQQHLDDFTKHAFSERLTGKKLERAARTFVTKIEERVTPAERRQKDDIFTLITKNPKTVMSSVSSPTVGDSEDKGCGYLGSKVNPNSIWDSEKLTKAAQTKGSDEIIRENKIKQAETKEKIKESYWQALHDKLASKDLVSNARVHSTSTQESASFNTKLPENAMSIFGDHKEFSNIPEKTAGETLKDQNNERSEKKAKENKEVQIKAAQTTKSGNWLFA